MNFKKKIQKDPNFLGRMVCDSVVISILGQIAQSWGEVSLAWYHTFSLYHLTGNSFSYLAVKFWVPTPSGLDATASQSQNGRPVKRFFARSFFISTRIVNLTGGKPIALNKTFLTQFTDWKSVQRFSRYLRKSVEILTKIAILDCCDHISGPIVSKLTPNMEET